MLKRNKGDILYLSDNKRIRYPSRIYDGESSFITAFSKNNLPSTLGSIGQFINTAVDSYKDNSSVKDMSGQKAIIEQQLNNSFDTSNNTTMKALFSGCSALTSLDVSKFNTAKVVNMNNMFYYAGYNSKTFKIF